MLDGSALELSPEDFDTALTFAVSKASKISTHLHQLSIGVGAFKQVVQPAPDDSALRDWLTS